MKTVKKSGIDGGSGNDFLPGTSGNDQFNGEAGNDTLNGGSGNDLLNGGVGADFLMGGVGNDWYFIDNNQDQIVEHYGQGEEDTALSTINYILGVGVENLRLLGTDPLNGTGNDESNVLWGNEAANRLSGDGGDDVLNGLGGEDTLQGDTGDDLYLVDSPEDQVIENGNAGDQDTVLAMVSYALTANVENLKLGGSDNIDGTGNAQDNRLVGNAGDNHLRGAAGNNELHGDNGDDILDGGDDPDRLYGEGGNDLLRGFGSSDTLDGGIGSDTMVGGTGDDTYVVDENYNVDLNIGDQIREAVDGGMDRVFSSVNYVLPDQVENLFLTGEVSDPTLPSSIGVGNGLNNYIRGNGGYNPLAGLGGDDTINGQAGADLMIGGQGNDLFVVDDDGDRVIEAAEDEEGTQGLEGTADKVLSSISYTLADNVELLELTGDEPINGIGNDEDNLILGNAQANILNGSLGGEFSGHDTLQGGNGNDIYIVDHDDLLRRDMVIEAPDQGIDELRVDATLSTERLPDNVENLTLIGNSPFSIHLNGNDLNNILTGNDEDNDLDGGAGNDTLRGGGGSDTYLLDSPGDVVEELPDQGDFDGVEVGFNYTLGDNVEHLFLTGNGNFNGTGNAEQNRLVGNDGNNTLRGLGADDILEGSDGNDTLEGGEGRDILDGGLGNDSMIGGLGNDSYILDNPLDVAVELPNQGIDTIRSSFTYDLRNTLFENLTLESADDINGTGNELDNRLNDNFGVNRLLGLGGNDVLFARNAEDTLEGGVGNDAYGIDDPNVTLIERPNEGTDTISVNFIADGFTYTLGDNFENLEFNGGNTAINGRGNSANNSITGNFNNNILEGLGGDDTLIGGIGNDIMRGGEDNDTYQGFTSIFAQSVINDSSGTADILDLSNYSSTQIVSWSALDGDDADNFVENLRVGLGFSGGIVIENYFDNTATQAAQSGAGTGLIESIQFSDRTLSFADVQALAIRPAPAAASSVTDADVNRLVADMGAYTATTENGNSVVSQGDSNNHSEPLQLVASG